MYEQELAWSWQSGIDPFLAWRPFKLLTLTVDPKRFMRDRSELGDLRARPEEAVAARRALMKGLNRLLTALRWQRRRHPTPNPAEWERDGTYLPYFAVPEYTKLGWPHLHVILIRREKFTSAEMKRIRQRWDKHGLGTSVDFANRNYRAVSPLHLAAYLAKYLGKGLEGGSHPHGARRWSSSRRFLPVAERRRWEGKAGWSAASVATHRIDRRRAGAVIRPLRRGFEWSWVLPTVDADCRRGPTDHVTDGLCYRPYYRRYRGLTFKERLSLTDRWAFARGAVVTELLEALQ